MGSERRPRLSTARMHEDVEVARERLGRSQRLGLGRREGDRLGAPGRRGPRRVGAGLAGRVHGVLVADHAPVGVEAGPVHAVDVELALGRVHGRVGQAHRGALVGGQRVAELAAAAGRQREPQGGQGHQRDANGTGAGSRGPGVLDCLRHGLTPDGGRRGSRTARSRRVYTRGRRHPAGSCAPGRAVTSAPTRWSCSPPARRSRRAPAAASRARGGGAGRRPGPCPAR